MRNLASSARGPVALTLAACIVPLVLAGPSPPPPTPTYEDLMRQWGKAPAAERTVAPGTVEVVLQTGHSAALTAVAVSADGRYLLSGARDESAKLWDRASGLELRTIQGLQAFLGLAFSADATRMIVRDPTSVRVYDTASGQQLQSFASTGGGSGPMLSADGRFALQVNGGATSVIDTATGALVWTVPKGSAQPLALSADGATLAMVRHDTRVGFPGGALFSRMPTGFTVNQTLELEVWDVASHKVRNKLSLPPASAQAMGAVSPDGSRLAIETTPGQISILDLRNGKVVETVSAGASAGGVTTSLAWSPDGHTLAWANTEDAARLWALPGGRLLAGFAASAVNFSPDGRSLVVGRAQGGTPYLRDLASGAETSLVGMAAEVTDLALTSDGRIAVAGMQDGTAKVWDLSTAQLLRSFACPGGSAASSVSVSPAAPLAALGCLNGAVALWNLATGSPVAPVLAPLNTDPAPAIARFSRDGRMLIVGVKERLLGWDVASSRAVQTIAVPMPAAAPASADAWFAQMTKMLPPQMAKSLPSVPPAPTGAPRAPVKSIPPGIRSLAVHPDGRHVAVGTSTSISLWDVTTGELVRRFGEAAEPNGPDLAANKPSPPAPNRGPGDRSFASLFGKSSQGGAAAPGGRIDPQAMDPSALIETLLGRPSAGADGGLAFSPDGRQLLALGARGKQVFDVVSGAEIRPPRAPTTGIPTQQAVMDMLGERVLPGTAGGIAYGGDGRIAARGVGRVIRLWDTRSGQELGELAGHASDVTSLAFSADGQRLVSAGRDGAIRVWSLAARKELVALLALGPRDFVAVTPDQYYRASKTHLNGVTFRVDGQLYPFEQFDLRFNRPDIVLERLGTAPDALIQGYRHAYQRRLSKLGFTEKMLTGGVHLPTVEMLSRDIPVSTGAWELPLRVRASDTRYPLDRFNVYVNDVPVFGTAGLPVGDKTATTAEQQLTVPLVPGRNKVQVSALNRQGAESLLQTVYTTATGEAPPPDVWVVTIGVSKYQNSAYNLRYAAKDASDLADTYRLLENREAPRGHVNVLAITDSQATSASISKAKEWLSQAKANDLVVVFAAGHGMTDSQQNYFFGTFDIDVANPAAHGLPFEEFEGMLDGIAALKKLLLVDTCFSGEIDKNDAEVVASTDEAGGGSVTMRSFKAARGITVSVDPAAPAGSAPSLSPDLLRLQQDWFADLRRGTGAVVISSSSGNEYSLEGEQWHNGVFTYALLQGLRNRAADANGDQIVTVSELQAYVIEQVRKLTNGGQNPTVRRENLDFDFAVY